MISQLRALLDEKLAAGTPWTAPEAAVELLTQAIAAGASAPFDAGNISGSTALDAADGLFQKAALTGAAELEPPSNGAEGAFLRLLLTASGADRALDLDDAILLPSDSAIEFPKTLASGKTYIVQLYFNGTAWCLVSFVGGY